MPFVASEKNVEACVVSSLLRPGVGRLEREAARRLRRSSTIRALYQRIAVAALQLDRCRSWVRARQAGGKNSVPSAVRQRRGDVGVGVSEQMFAARPGVPDRGDDVADSSRCTLTFHTCTRGFLEIPLDRPDRVGDAALERRFGNVGLAMTTRGVAGGFVTVTIRFCWLLVLKYSP